ncbi:MAG TPA: glycosyl transferase family 1, partial [Anaerolineae bacterium]|nr:glycosyl transferase family 1 [Anaerolineae bacterium]
TTYGATTSTVPTPKELVDGENVLLVPSDNAPLLADAILRLLKSPVVQQRLSEGAGTLSRLFDWESIAARHMEVYGGLA